MRARKKPSTKSMRNSFSSRRILTQSMTKRSLSTRRLSPHFSSGCAMPLSSASSTSASAARARWPPNSSGKKQSTPRRLVSRSVTPMLKRRRRITRNASKMRGQLASRWPRKLVKTRRTKTTKKSRSSTKRAPSMTLTRSIQRSIFRPRSSMTSITTSVMSSRTSKALTIMMPDI